MRARFAFPLLSLFALASCGDTVTEPPPALDAEIVATRAPRGVVVGFPYYLAVTLRNTGTEAWTPDRGVRVATHGDDWMVEFPITDTVRPGAEIMLDTTVTAPGLLGSFILRWQALDSEDEWFGERSAGDTVTVHPVGGYEASFVSQSVPTSMKTGQEYEVTVRMRNEGSGRWLGRSTFHLGSEGPMDNMTWAVRRATLASDVAPGDTATFTFKVKAPVTPGTYPFSWRMLIERVEWFGQPTPSVSINVSN